VRDKLHINIVSVRVLMLGQKPGVRTRNSEGLANLVPCEPFLFFEVRFTTFQIWLAHLRSGS